jgi:hypothetical protein
MYSIFKHFLAPVPSLYEIDRSFLIHPDNALLLWSFPSFYLTENDIIVFWKKNDDAQSSQKPYPIVHTIDHHFVFCCFLINNYTTKKVLDHLWHTMSRHSAFGLWFLFWKTKEVWYSQNEIEFFHNKALHHLMHNPIHPILVPNIHRIIDKIFHTNNVVFWYTQDYVIEVIYENIAKQQDNTKPTKSSNSKKKIAVDFSNLLSYLLDLFYANNPYDIDTIEQTIFAELKILSEHKNFDPISFYALILTFDFDFGLLLQLQSVVPIPFGSWVQLFIYSGDWNASPKILENMIKKHLDDLSIFCQTCVAEDPEKLWYTVLYGVALLRQCTEKYTTNTLLYGSLIQDAQMIYRQLIVLCTSMPNIISNSQELVYYLQMLENCFTIIQVSNTPQLGQLLTYIKNDSWMNRPIISALIKNNKIYNELQIPVFLEKQLYASYFYTFRQGIAAHTDSFFLFLSHLYKTPYSLSNWERKCILGSIKYKKNNKSVLTHLHSCMQNPAYLHHRHFLSLACTEIEFCQQDQLDTVEISVVQTIDSGHLSSLLDLAGSHASWYQSLHTVERFYQDKKMWFANSLDLTPIINLYHKTIELLLRENTENSILAAIKKSDISLAIQNVGYKNYDDPNQLNKREKFERYISSLPVISSIPMFSTYKLHKLMFALAAYNPEKRFGLDSPKAFALFFLLFGRKKCEFGLANLFYIHDGSDLMLFNLIKRIHVLQDIRNRLIHESTTTLFTEELWEEIRLDAFYILNFWYKFI